MAPFAPNLPTILATAVEAARAAGAVLCDLRQRGQVAVNRRDRHDVKLEADVRAEAAIFDVLRSRRPGDGILSEEAGEGQLGRPGVWIVDPLDGTVNYSHGHPHFAVSIAWLWEGRLEAGVVFDPVRDELFEAVRGSGACLNGEPVTPSRLTDLAESMIAVGFGKWLPEVFVAEAVTALSRRVQKLRIDGSAALDIAYTACGRYDAFYEDRIFSWDIAAGALILQEAGGNCLTWRRENPYQRTCLATNGALTPGLIEILSLDPATQCADLLDARAASGSESPR